MKRKCKIKLIGLFIILTSLSLFGCGQQKSEPVTLSMWHVYGEQAASPMDELVDEFNSTVGKEEGIVVNVTATSNASEIGGALLDSQANKSGAKAMPDLFFCHTSNALALGKENLVDWNDYVSDEELSTYVDDFLDEGRVDGELIVFPVSKSTHMLFINGSLFDRFSNDTGVTYEQLSTWDGFFDTAEKFYTWSEGKPFCAVDYLLRAIDLACLSDNPETELYDADGWYNLDNATFQKEWGRFASSLVKGHISLSDLYSNTQVMTGETAAGISSSAAILYYNDTVTYSDNTSEPMNLVVLPLPVSKKDNAFDTQAGVGLCAYKTTDEKAEASAVFAKWLTESERNLKFVTDTGYMPVRKDAFEQITDIPFKNEDYQELYRALGSMREHYTFVKESTDQEYYMRAYRLYDEIREKQGEWKKRYAEGEDEKVLLDEFRQVFRGIN